MIHKIFQSSFTGTRLDNLTRTSTICGYSSIRDSSNNLIDISGNGHDLSPINSPTITYTDILDKYGNMLQGITLDGTNQYYSIAHSADFNVTDQDFTITILARIDSGAAGTDTIFSHGNANGGVYIDYNTATNTLAAHFNDTVVATVDVEWDDYDLADNRIHVIQLIRSSNNAKLGVDSAFDASEDVTNVGTDVNVSLYLGADSTPGNYFDGKIPYFRLDSEALDDDTLGYQANLLRGINADYQGGSVKKYWSITRAGDTSYKEIRPNIIIQQPPNCIQVVSDKAILIESSTTNVITRSSEFNSWTNVGLGVTADNATGPRINDGSYADLLDSGGDVNAYRYIATANLGDLTGKDYSASIYLNASIPHIITAQIVELGVAATSANFYVTNNWKKYSFSRSMVGGGTGVLRFSIYGGEAAVAGGAAWAADAQLENNAFTTSPIVTSASTATRNADDITFDIPSIFQYLGNSYYYKKIYIEFEMKTLAETMSTDLSTSQCILSISGNTGTAAFTRNNLFHFWFNTDGTFRMYSYDNSSTNHVAQTGADAFVPNTWNTIRGYLDCSDLSNMDMWINGSNSGLAYAGNAGTCDFDLSNCNIRLGQIATGTVNGNHYIRNLKIWIED